MSQAMCPPQLGNQEINLIVNYLPQSVTDSELYYLFASFGEVTSVHVVRDYITGYSHGYGFVTFYKPEDAQKAINAINGLVVENKTLKVSFARPHGKDQKYANLYITNLPTYFTEIDLERFFGTYGEIIQRKVLYDRMTKLPRGVGFVRFATRLQAEAALSNLNGYQVDKNFLPLNIKFAEPYGHSSTLALQCSARVAFMKSKHNLAHVTRGKRHNLCTNSNSPSVA